MGISHPRAVLPAPCRGEPGARRSGVWRIAKALYMWEECNITFQQHIGHIEAIRSWQSLLPPLFTQLWKCYLEKFVVVTQYFVSHKMIPSKLLTCQCNFFHLKDGKILYLKSFTATTAISARHICHLFIMVTSPPNLFQQVSKVRPNWEVVLPWPKLAVEMLIVARILLENHAVPCQQVGKSVCSDGAINVNLVFVLGTNKWGKHRSEMFYFTNIHLGFDGSLTLKKSKNETCLTIGP